MSVTTKHRQYIEMEYSWRAIRDAYQGSGAVKGAVDERTDTRGVKIAGTRYLPRPLGMTDEIYSSYRDRARWLNATEHAVNGLTGAGFRREPVVEVPASLEDQLLDVTQTGMSLRSFAEETVREDVKMGRFGILIDQVSTLHASFAPPALMPTAAQRPYWIPYRAEEIRNWRKVHVQGQTILTLVVLEECVPVVQHPWGTDDFFVVVYEPQYRVLRLNDDGQYEVSVWKLLPGSPQRRDRVPVLMETFLPLRFGAPLDFIPFLVLNPFSLETDVQKSLVEGIVEINYLNYRHSADKEQALHLLIPTPYICSDGDPPAEPLLRGSYTAWWIPGSNSKVGNLDGPHSLQPFETAMAEDIKEMASLGARLIEPGPLVPETATAALARTAGADSPMQALLRTASRGLTQALQWHAWWAGKTESVHDPAIHLSLNTDLIATQMEPQMLTALTQALLQNTISYETYWFNLQQGEIARPLIDADEEQELIQIRQEQQPLAPVLPPRPGVVPGRNGAPHPAPAA